MQEKLKEQEIKKLFSKKLFSVRQLAFEQDQNYPTRQQMEDAHFIADNILGDGHSGLFGVMDGHGGTYVVNFVANIMPQIFKDKYKSEQKNMKRLFAEIFKEIDEQLRKQQVPHAEDSGTCICVALIKQEATITPIPNKVCIIANLGDTRAVLNEDGVAKRLSYDHKAKDPKEQERVKKDGGVIFNNRVGGQLAVTRALGDLDFKTEGVTNEPNVVSFDITPKTRYIIMASDGLWDVVTDEDAIELTKKKQTSQEIAAELLATAKKRGSKDNIAIMVIQFQ